MDFNIRKPLANAAEKFNCLVADPKLRIEEGHSALKVIKTLLVGTVQDGWDLMSDWIIAEGTASETIFVPARFCQINGRVVHPAVICPRDCVDNNGNKIRALGVKAYSCVPARGVAAGYGGRSIDYPYSTYLVSLNRATHLLGGPRHGYMLDGQGGGIYDPYFLAREGMVNVHLSIY